MLWVILFIITLAFAVFCYWMFQTQTKRVEQLELENWVLRRKLDQWHELWTRKQMNRDGKMVDAIFAGQEKDVDLDWWEQELGHYFELPPEDQ